MPPRRIVCYIVRAMNATTFTRRTLLGTSAAAAVVPLRGHAETLQHLDLLIDWKPAPRWNFRPDPEMVTVSTDRGAYCSPGSCYWLARITENNEAG